MRKLIISALIMISAFIGGQSFVRAQQEVDDGTYNQAPLNDTAGQVGGVTSEQGDGFDWRWLLPLLAIPFFFLFRRDNRNEDRSAYRDRRFAGTKGGRSNAERDEESD